MSEKIDGDANGYMPLVIFKVTEFETSIGEEITSAVPRMGEKVRVVTRIGVIVGKVYSVEWIFHPAVRPRVIVALINSVVQPLNDGDKAYFAREGE